MWNWFKQTFPENKTGYKRALVWLFGELVIVLSLLAFAYWYAG